MLLIIDSYLPSFIQRLDTLDIEVCYRPEADRTQVLTEIAEAEILLIHSKIKVDKELLDRAVRLKLIVRSGVGMDHIDLDYCAAKDIAARNCPGTNADAVGEQTLAMMLAMHCRLLIADKEVRQFVWRREANRGAELKHKTVGLIGYGNTGKAVAQRLLGFGCRILAYDKYKIGFGNKNIEECDLEKIFAETDVLSLHLPLTDETRDWVNADFIDTFTKPLMLLNLSRGPIVYLPDLVQKLEEGKLLSAALDVLPNEKFDTLDSQVRSLYTKLFAMSNVILTPHIGGWTVASRQNILDAVFQHLKAGVLKLK